MAIQFYLDIALQTTGRCPRCGYTLRYDGYGYSCDFCGYPHMRRTLSGFVRDLERSLKTKVQNFLEGTRGTPSQPLVTYYPVTLRQLRPCIACGVNIPLGTRICPTCGTAQVAPQTIAPVPGTTSVTPSAEQRVLDYIANHNGTISISQAAQDLSMSPNALRSTIERLKTAGFLSQA